MEWNKIVAFLKVEKINEAFDIALTKGDDTFLLDILKNNSN